MGKHQACRTGAVAACVAGRGLRRWRFLALNAYIEREVDALMSRTETRPVPEGRIQPLAALAFWRSS